MSWKAAKRRHLPRLAGEPGVSKEEGGPMGGPQTVAGFSTLKKLFSVS